MKFPTASFTLILSTTLLLVGCGGGDLENVPATQQTVVLGSVSKSERANAECPPTSGCTPLHRVMTADEFKSEVQRNVGQPNDENELAPVLQADSPAN